MDCESLFLFPPYPVTFRNSKCLLFLYTETKMMLSLDMQMCMSVLEFWMVLGMVKCSLGWIDDVT